VLSDDRGLREVGTHAAVLEVLERYDDGRLDILIEGRERFRIAELRSGRAFHVGLVTDVVDDDDPASPADQERALELFRELRELIDDEVEDPDEEAELSFALGARVDFGPEAKQELIESRSERIRLARVSELLEIALGNARILAERADIASRNGHLKKG
jgi:Lon protease-like protein